MNLHHRSIKRVFACLIGVSMSIEGLQAADPTGKPLPLTLQYQLESSAGSGR
ncbi:MAG: hypothetical protein ACI92S_002213, partial [Planctomycetaceae bacterium]